MRVVIYAILSGFMLFFLFMEIIYLYKMRLAYFNFIHLGVITMMIMVSVTMLVDWFEVKEENFYTISSITIFIAFLRSVVFLRLFRTTAALGYMI